jgi:sulfate transport system permease protein
MTTDVNRRVLPGFALSLGYTMFYLSLLVLIPISAGVVKASTLSFQNFWDAVSGDRAVAAYTLTVGASFVSAAIDIVIGVLVAWVLVRYQFPLKGIFDALVDLPFALPTAVAGLVYSDLYVENGWLGRFLVPLGIQGAYSRLGIVLVLTFIGFPFVVRTLQPVIENLDTDIEEAAACLGANRWQTVTRVLLPAVWPATITAFALAFARGLGEYGSVVFISGNMPLRTETVPLLIVTKLEQFDYAGATAIALVMALFKANPSPSRTDLLAACPGRTAMSGV